MTQENTTPSRRQVDALPSLFLASGTERPRPSNILPGLTYSRPGQATLCTPALDVVAAVELARLRCASAEVGQ